MELPRTFPSVRHSLKGRMHRHPLCLGICRNCTLVQYYHTDKSFRTDWNLFPKLLRGFLVVCPHQSTLFFEELAGYQRSDTIFLHYLLDYTGISMAFLMLSQHIDAP